MKYNILHICSFMQPYHFMNFFSLEEIHFIFKYLKNYYTEI